MIQKVYKIIPVNYRKKVLSLFLLIAVGMFFEVFGIGMLLPVLTAILQPDMLFKNALLSNIFVFFEVGNNAELIRFSLLFLLIIYTLKGLFLLGTNFVQNHINAGLVALVSSKLYSKFIHYPYLYHTTNNSSEYIKTIQVEVNNFNVFLMAGIYFITETSIILSVLIALLLIEPKGTLVLMLLFLLCSYIFYRISKKLSIRWGKIREANDKAITQKLLETFGGIKELIITNSFTFFENEYNELNATKANISAKNLTLNQVPRYYLEVIIVIAFVLFIGSYLYAGNSVDSLLVILGVFVGATLRLLPSINRVLSSLQQIKYYQSSIDIIFDELQKNEKTNSMDLTVSEMPTIHLEKAIQVQNLSFSYPNSKRETLQDLSFTIPQGATIGIVGTSGSGKSTLINLIAGLIYPYTGKILIDDILLDDSSCLSWRNQIGYVSQHTYLSDATIMENIAYGIEKKKISVERVNRVIDEAQIKDLVDELENGMNHKVGERGVQFSGGQQQRIGIARALYRDPEILILDEATSALDIHTEKKVMQSIDNLKGRKTVIIVTHRLSTIENCDSIFQLVDGRIVNQNANTISYEH